jgi:molybdopterin converting factor small subunit
MPAGCSVHDLAKQLDIQEGSVNAVAINGETGVEDAILQDGDEVRFFPPSAGG